MPRNHNRNPLYTGALKSRRSWAACFKNQKTKGWHADFTGVVVLESGEAFWVNVYEKFTHKGLSGGLTRKKESGV